MSFDKSVELLKVIEGFYSNDADDEGGETMFGLSRLAYPHLDFSTLTWEKAKKVYFEDYWAPLYGDELDPQLAQILFILAVNTSTPKHPKRAVSMLQSVLNTFIKEGKLLDVDGVMGPKSVEMCQKVCKKYSEALKMAFVGEIYNFYTRLVKEKPEKHKFYNGWLMRVWRSAYE